MKTKNNTHDLIIGIHPVVELLKAKKRKLHTIYTTKPEPKAWESIKKHWPKYPVQIQYVKREVLHKLAGTTDHQGIVAYANPLPIRKKPFTPDTHPYLLLLDGVQDPRNVGAIIRSAFCTGVNGIIIPQKGAAPLTASALKAAAGLAEHIDIYQPPSSASAIQEISNAGYNLYITTVTNGENAAHVQYNMPCCLIIGSEGKGVSPEVLKTGTKITLPEKVPGVSYNASVAAGIFLFLIASQQKLI